MPYIEYAVNKDYIANNLCINRDNPHSCCEGKCYLEKQIRKSSESGDSKGNQTNNKVQNEDLKEFVTSLTSNSKVFETHLQQPVKSETFNITKIVPAIFVPPQV